jgi:hypothetical protein
MTMQIELPADALGLAGGFPRPGWVVLDAIRERRYTGEVVFATSPEVRVYADLGRIYLAERVTDPGLGARLVDAGVLNGAQLERGVLRVAGGDHLGRLFERVPSVDRHAVIVMTELMTEECVGWVAAQRVNEIEVTPYRHHPSGVHRWDRPFGDIAPGDPLPAPPPDAAPVDLGTPEPLFTPIDAIDADPMITWNEPAFLDERPPQPRPERRGSDDEPTVEMSITDPVVDRQPQSQPQSQPQPSAGDDWIDLLGTVGLPERGSDPLASPIRLPGLFTEPIDRFEMIWPSGEIDEQFGIALTEDLPNPDHDRVGPTARMVRDAGTREAPEPPSFVGAAPPVVDETELAGVGSDADSDVTRQDDLVDSWPGNDSDGSLSDDVVMAVRRAVASIETGSLAARRRIAEASASELGSPDLLVPARLAVRLENGQVAPVATVRTHRANSGSVFDDLLAGPDSSAASAAATPADVTPPQPEQPRVGALRRLIGSLRRR